MHVMHVMQCLGLSDPFTLGPGREASSTTPDQTQGSCKPWWTKDGQFPFTKHNTFCS